MNQTRHSYKIPTLSPYFAIDGPEGVGKSTFIPKLKKYLEDKGYDVITVREPGETKAGEIIRAAILKEDLGLDENLHLFLADRILTQQLVIIPALREGKVVLSDRCLLTSLIYQGLIADKENAELTTDRSFLNPDTPFPFEALSYKRVLRTHESFREFIYPSKILIPQLELEESLKRIQKREGDNNWIDKKPKEFHISVHEFFNTASEWSPFAIGYLDFNRSDEENLEQAYQHLKPLLPQLPIKRNPP